MFKRIAYFFVVFTPLLPSSGCNSFNHNTYLELSPVKESPPITVLTLKEARGASEAGIRVIKAPPIVQDPVPKNWCPPYKPPVLPEPPKAPLDQLNSVKPTDVAAIEKMSAKHIVELHNYITQTRTTLIKSYNDYVSACQAAHKRVKKTD
jgi:hypothetical protein